MQSMWSKRRRAAALCGMLGGCGAWAGAGLAQSCTTQARMTAQQRSEIGAAAYALGTAVLAGDATRLRAGTVTQFAGDANQAAFLVRSTAAQIAGDSLAVTQVYLLEAPARTTGNAATTEFACALTGTVSETDFDIPGLPAGRFAFAMVEAQGPNPWLLAFLLQQEGGPNGTWKMAGFYPHARSVAGHDGIWYWTAARADAKASKPWLAWVLYGEADQLLRPAAFVSSGNLDKLRTEQRTAAPEPLSNGLNAETPLALVGANGAEFQVTSLAAQSADGGKTLNLEMHVKAGGETSGEAATARSVAAATALFTAHPELRGGFSNVWVVADSSTGNPFVVQRPIGEIGTVGR